jgi:S1-C subfamily serine protease
MFHQAKKALVAVTTLVTLVSGSMVTPSLAHAEKKRRPTASRAADTREDASKSGKKDRSRNGKSDRKDSSSKGDKSATEKPESEATDAATELKEVKPETADTTRGSSTPKDTSSGKDDATESKEARDTREAKEARRRGEGFTKAIEKISGAVVQVRTMPSGGKEMSGPAGSGVLISSDGTIVTSNRLIEQASSIDVRTKDGHIVKATLVGRDPVTDIAVLKIDTSGLTGVTAARIGSGVAKVGSWVVRVGATGDGRSSSAGILGSLGHDGLGASHADDFASLDVTPAASTAGSPVVDEDGDLLGISLHPAARNASTTLVVSGGLMKRVVDQIQSKGHVSRGWHGLGAQDLTPQVANELGATAGEGALVNVVAIDSPGARGNLRPGDVVVTVEGASIHTAHAMQRALGDVEPGKSVSLEVLRSGKRYAASFTMGAAKSAPANTPAQTKPSKDDGFGMTLTDESSSVARKHGLGPGPICQVTGVQAGSVAERSGLRVNDLILEADGKVRPGASYIEKSAADNHLLLRVRRGDAIVYVALAR